MKALWLVALLLIVLTSGCAQPEPEVITETVEVEVASDECLDALDHADTALRDMVSTLQTYTDLVSNLAAGDTNAAGRSLQAVADLEDVGDAEPYTQYVAAARECRSQDGS